MTRILLIYLQQTFNVEIPVPEQNHILRLFREIDGEIDTYKFQHKDQQNHIQQGIQNAIENIPDSFFKVFGDYIKVATEPKESQLWDIIHEYEGLIFKENFAMIKNCTIEQATHILEEILSAHSIAILDIKDSTLRTITTDIGTIIVHGTKYIIQSFIATFIFKKYISPTPYTH